MKLTKFQVTDFRSINDSTPIKAVDRTVLVGRNESGKSALLRVLHGLKPQGKLPTFTLARDFPRDRHRRDFNEGLRVLGTWWTLEPEEMKRLVETWPRAAAATEFRVTRSYKAERTVDIEPVVPLDTLAEPVRNAARALAGLGLTEASALAAIEMLTVSADAVVGEGRGAQWAASVQAAVVAARAAIGSASPLAEQALRHIAEVEKGAAAVAADATQSSAARDLIFEMLPTFVYLDEWEEIPGHHDLAAYLTRQGQNALTADDRLFEKLMKVAELDAKELHQLLGQNHEERKLLTNRAGRVLTKTIQSLWKDRKITVDFSLDEKHFDVLVLDEDTQALVPLDERSRGFRWYFSFFITFAADTAGGEKEKAILLLDEPGLFLHATAQAALLEFLEQLPNQVIFSTHSPFMIDPKRIDSVRTVNLVEGKGTTVSDVPTGDTRTLFPLQAALGYDLTQTLFVGAETVLVEGVTDYWYLSAASDYLREQGREGLKRGTVITPAGGAPKVPYMVALLTAQNLNVVVLFDSEPQAEATGLELQKQKLIRPEGIVWIRAAFDPPAAKGADVEDLLGADVFQRLVEESYAKELAGRKVPWNSAIPRGAVRAAEAFGALGIDFHKTRPARLFLDRMAKDPGGVMPGPVQDRVERLCKQLNAAVVNVGTTGRAPFTPR